MATVALPVRALNKRVIVWPFLFEGA
jgi:hypothetical protein